MGQKGNFRYRMGIKIVVYTHTDYKRAWTIWFGQTEKYFPNVEKIIFVNKHDEDIPKNYTVVEYDDRLPYNKRVSRCLSNLSLEDVIIFHHEDMFLYDKPDYTLLEDFYGIVKNVPNTLIKLLRAGEGESAIDIHPNLYKNPSGLNFSIQPTIIKVGLLSDIYTKNQGSSIWEFEKIAGETVNTEHSYYCYSGEKKRGLAHYDSNTYPYVATAIVKGSWNLHEYSIELNKLFYEYKINSI